MNEPINSAPVAAAAADALESQALRSSYQPQEAQKAVIRTRPSATNKVMPVDFEPAPGYVGRPAPEVPPSPASPEHIIRGEMLDRKPNSSDYAPPTKHHRKVCWPEKGNPRVQEALKKFDVQEGDVVKYDQVVRLLEHVAGNEGAARLPFSFSAMLVAALLLVLVLLGGMTGLTWTIVSVIKDTQVGPGGLLMVKGGRNEVVRTDVNDMQVVDGVLVGRAAYRQAVEYAAVATAAAAGKPSSALDAAVTWQRGGAVDPATAGVLRTATFKGNRQRFSSRVNIEALMELNYVYLESGTGAQVALVVNGVARIPTDSSVWGSVVRIMSAAGTLTLDDTVVHFAEDVAPVFSEAGFTVTSSAGTGARRRLLGDTYTLYGYFNSIQNMTAFDPVDVSKPKLPTGNYTIALRIYEPCTLLDDTVDRCVYDSSSSATAAAAKSSGGRREMLQTGAGTNSARNLPGVEEVNGVRYMTHRRRVTYLGQLVRSVSTFASTPAYQRVQLMDMATGAVSEWQEETHPEDADLDSGAARGMCTSYTVAGDHLLRLTSLLDVSATEFKYLGDEQKLGSAARHFVYTAKQPTLTGVKGNETLSIHYWDTIEGFRPVAFELSHPVLGDLRYLVEEVRHITASSLAQSAWAPPAPEGCRVGCMPRLGSAFSVPSSSQRWAPAAGGSGVAHRRLASTLSADDESKDMRRTLMAADSSSTADSPAPALCSKELEARQSLPLGGSCNLELGVRASKYVAFNVSCGRDSSALSALSSLQVGGRASVDTCSGSVDGCLLGGLTVPADCCRDRYATAYAVYNGLGAGVVALKMCGGFDHLQRQGCLSGVGVTAPSVNWAGRVEGYSAMRLSSCCTWLSEVGFESYVGVSIGLLHMHHSVGAVDLARDTFLSGSQAAAAAAEVPSVANVATEIVRVGDVSYPAEYFAFVGYYGDWSPWAYCYNDLGAGKLQGTPMTGFRLRMDQSDESTSRDNTALNAVEFSCADGSTARPASGLYGAWTKYSNCPIGSYVVAARMRVADLQLQGGDNTAANSVALRCSDGTEIVPDEGYEGTWRDWVACPTNAYLCGARVRVLPYQGARGDDSALNGMQLVCCRG